MGGRAETGIRACVGFGTEAWLVAETAGTPQPGWIVMAHQAVEAAEITKMASEDITGEIFGSTAELNPVILACRKQIQGHSYQALSRDLRLTRNMCACLPTVSGRQPYAAPHWPWRA